MAILSRSTACFFILLQKYYEKELALKNCNMMKIWNMIG